MSTRKRTFDEIQVEISRINHGLTHGGDHSVLKPALALLEREAYAVLANPHTPQNHATYVSARDGQQVALLQAEIANIDRALASDPAARVGMLRGDRERFVKMLEKLGVVLDEPAATMDPFEAVRHENNAVHSPNLSISELVPIASEAAPPIVEELPYTEREYPCGCKASGPGKVPNYCPEHNEPRYLTEGETQVLEEIRETKAAAEYQLASEAAHTAAKEIQEAAEDDDAADAPTEDPVTDDSEDLPF